MFTLKGALNDASAKILLGFLLQFFEVSMLDSGIIFDSQVFQKQSADEAIPDSGKVLSKSTSIAIKNIFSLFCYHCIWVNFGTFPPLKNCPLFVEKHLFRLTKRIFIKDCLLIRSLRLI